MKETILVMSGKGGVGKTTVAINLAYSLFLRNKSVGILDVDIHGPNVLKMFGKDNVKQEIINEKLIPFKINDRLKISSLAGFVSDESAVIWRGPRKHNAIKQLSEDVDWGNIDYLIVDFPPGTGDEHISCAQLLKDIKGAVIISTPQKVSLMDMDRSVDFCKKMNIPIIGTIENMSGGIFGSNTVEEKSKLTKLNFLGKITLSKSIIDASQDGKSFLEVEDKRLKNSFENIVNNIIKNINIK